MEPYQSHGPPHHVKHVVLEGPQKKDLTHTCPSS